MAFKFFFSFFRSDVKLAGFSKVFQQCIRGEYWMNNFKILFAFFWYESFLKIIQDWIYVFLWASFDWVSSTILSIEDNYETHFLIEYFCCTPPCQIFLVNVENPDYGEIQFHEWKREHNSEILWMGKNFPFSKY